jgi:hypothetical protein
MSTIRRQDFVTTHANKSVSIAKVQQDPVAKAELQNAGLSVQDLQRADRNRDGAVDADEAFSAADRFDRDGNAATLVALDRVGAPTPAGKATNALGVMLQNPNLQAPPPAPRSNDNVLFVGMNPPTRESAGAPHEINNLRQKGVNVTAVTDSAVGDDKIKVGNTVHDLTTAAGRTGFVRTLNLPEEQSRKVADAIGRAGPDAKDEMAGIAQTWAKAERGEMIPSRLVLSGHNVGSGPWGDGNGQIKWENLKELSQAMPKAAGQVEDLNISACYSGGSHNWGKYREIFPNARTIWAYSGSAPGSGSGATTHQEAWERATRGSGTDIAGATATLQQRGVRKAENIATTTGTPGAAAGPALADLRATVQAGEQTYQGFFTGQQAVQNTQSGPLRDHYNNLQRLLQHPDLPAPERREVEARRDQTIRLLFYKTNIGPRFEGQYGSSVQAGYRALGMTPPNFSTMSRAEAMASIQEYRNRLAANQDPPTAARNAELALAGLWNLDSRIIPETWI